MVEPDVKRWVNKLSPARLEPGGPQHPAARKPVQRLTHQCPVTGAVSQDSGPCQAAVVKRH